MKNAISFSILGGSVSVGRRAATTFLNLLVLPEVLILLACLCLPVHAQTGEWAWMSGSRNNDGYNPPPGVYGTLGTPAAGNTPGDRAGAASWTDSSGHLWLFGGEGVDAIGGGGELNDLWEFNPSTHEWAWMSGGSTMPSGSCAQLGVYGMLGVPAAGNTPGGREYAASWTDSSGNLWLFGGDGCNANGYYGTLNDLWKFNPSTNEWTWMGGSSTVDSPAFSKCVISGVYGTLGMPAAGNIPGSRDASATWTDSSGNLWLFGGGGCDANGNSGGLNDLWEFNPSTNQWAWMGGSSTVNQPGVYGTLGTPAAGNIPGSRNETATWTDSSGNFWLFGGECVDANGNSGLLNDLWEFNPSTNEWTWMGGSSTVNNGGIFGVYGTLGTPAAGNIPGSRSESAFWTDSNGNFWLFGGRGFAADGYGFNSFGDLNDLWEFNPSTMEWTWVGGTNSANNPGVYGTLGTPASGNVPGSRELAVHWTDSSGNPWLFGGFGHNEGFGGIPGYLNNLWVLVMPGNTLPAAMPIFSSPAGVYTSVQTVSISDATTGATIYYTIDGTTPSVGSTVYSGPITVSTTETIQAIAVATGFANSAVASATYTITPPAATPTFSPAAGTYTIAQTVSISDTTAGATIYYTTNGTTPTVNSTVYTGAITVSVTETIQAIATTTGYSQSAVATAAYSITPTFTIAGTAVSVAPGATIGNTSTITVTPLYGFTGMVALSCTITPTAASDPATCSIVPSSVTISSTTAQTAALTVYTTAATALNRPMKLFWPSADSAVLALAFFFGIPAQRRRWRTMLGMIIFIVALAGGVSACDGRGGGGGGTSVSGTTAGTYTVTVTGTSGTTTATGVVALTVQ